MPCSRKSSTTSHGNSCDSSISAARGAIRSRAMRAHELADLELLVGQRLPGHGRSLGRQRACTDAAGILGDRIAVRRKEKLDGKVEQRRKPLAARCGREPLLEPRVRLQPESIGARWERVAGHERCQLANPEVGLGEVRRRLAARRRRGGYPRAGTPQPGSRTRRSSRPVRAPVRQALRRARRSSAGASRWSGARKPAARVPASRLRPRRRAGSKSTRRSPASSAYERTSCSQPSGPPWSGVQAGCGAVHVQRPSRSSSITAPRGTRPRCCCRRDRGRTPRSSPGRTRAKPGRAVVHAARRDRCLVERATSAAIAAVNPTCGSADESVAADAEVETVRVGEVREPLRLLEDGSSIRAARAPRRSSPSRSRGRSHPPSRGRSSRSFRRYSRRA